LQTFEDRLIFMKKVRILLGYIWLICVRLEVFCAFVAHQHEHGEILENVEIGVEEGCSNETHKALVPIMNGSSNGSSIYQMVTNADGTVSLVKLDAAQLDQLLHIQGDEMLCIVIAVISNY